MGAWGILLESCLCVFARLRFRVIFLFDSEIPPPQHGTWYAKTALRPRRFGNFSRAFLYSYLELSTLTWAQFIRTVFERSFHAIEVSK